MNNSSIIESCIKDKEISDIYNQPMKFVGIYIYIASAFCFLSMLSDLINGFKNKKNWFPSKRFSLNAASIMAITIALKLPLDLTSLMPSYVDLAAKIGSLGFMCTMMANLMPSLASMDNNTLLSNMVGLSVFVITLIVNICIQIYTGVVGGSLPGDRYMNFPIVFTPIACIHTALMLLLLLIMVSLSLAIPVCKEILESNYQALVNNISLADQPPQDMSRVEELRQRVRRYWVMAETGSPQFAMASNPLSIASGLICLVVFVINLVMLLKFVIIRKNETYYRQVDISNGIREDEYSPSPYQRSTTLIFIWQFLGIMVGVIAPLFRCYSVFSFKNYFMVLKVEKYWTQKLHEWKEIPLHFKSLDRRGRNIIYNLTYIVLSLCIGFQKMIVILCKVVWIIVTAVIIFVVRCFTPLFSSTTDDIDEDLSIYVLQVDDERELAERTLKCISKSVKSFISRAETAQHKNLLELLKKSIGFQGVENFDTDLVQPLHSVELVNSWSLPIVTLTCIAVALPNICIRLLEYS